MEQPPALTDFPKLYCPFLRQTFRVNVEQWKMFGAKLGLREPQAYLVVDNLKRRGAGQVWRAKLRRDMFEWFYSGQVEIQ